VALLAPIFIENSSLKSSINPRAGLPGAFVAQALSLCSRIFRPAPPLTLRRIPAFFKENRRLGDASRLDDPRDLIYDPAASTPEAVHDPVQ